LECPKSGVAKIINDDGTIGQYPDEVEPEFPDDEDDEDYARDRARYNTLIKIYYDWRKDLADEKRKLVAHIKSNMGPDSLSRVRATENGRNAINNDDPKVLLQEIYATHNTDLLLDRAQNVVIAEKRFNAVQQGEQEELIAYFERFKALRQALSNALTNNEEDADARMPTEANQAVLFIIGLNATYRTFKRSFVDGTNTEGYPVTLAVAFERAQRASTDIITYRRYNDYRGVFMAERNGRGSRGGRGGGRQSGGRGYHGRGRGNTPRLCYVCRQPGHIAAQCPDRDDAVINQALHEDDDHDVRGNA
jgi:Zinc knuckle